MDARALADHKLRTGALKGFPGTDAITNDDLLGLDVTVLFPAALENAITRDNASRLRCPMVCDLADGPTAPEADRS